VRTIAGGGVAVIVLAFLARELLRQLLTKDLEKARAERDRDLEAFKANLSRELEAYKGEVQRQTAEAGVRHAKVHERLHQVLPEIYEAFFGLLGALRFACGFNSTPEKAAAHDQLVLARQARERAINAFNLRVLYLSGASGAKCHAFLDKTLKCEEARMNATPLVAGEPAQAGQHRAGALAAAREIFEAECETALFEVFNDFQRLLAVAPELVARRNTP
jgi:hypothetical protein